ncbi:MAG TPA: NADP-dependent oxidoreductase [Acidobacteriaceae bacterium]|jgi:NADPH:quinone reductase-like Zn-dependent oxidoreductase|nr:NADP-dependent oxidoreductase [Acidobacteriaceae bacterium]
MKAVVLYEYGDVNNLKFENDWQETPIGPDEVRVRVRATSINPIDWKLRSGAAQARMPLKFPAILGRDLAGEVDHFGPDVTGFKKGQRVLALANATYAEFTTVKANILAPIPDGLSFEQAAALPLVLTTGAQLIERAVQVQSGWTILVTGALGGVGRTAVHVARKHGAHVLAGVKSSQREEAAKLGAERVIALDDEKDIASLSNLDAIADTVNGETIAKLLGAMKPGGILGSVLGEPKAAAGKNIQVRAFMAQPDASRLYQLAEDVAHGEFSIPIAKKFPLEKAGEAQDFAENGHAGGKVLLIP